MVMRFFLEFFGDYHDFLGFYYGNKMVGLSDILWNWVGMVACSFYYHVQFQKNNLWVLGILIPKRLPWKILIKKSKNGKAALLKIPKWNWGASRLFLGSKFISMIMHIFIFHIFLEYYHKNIIISILVAKFLKNVFVTLVQMSTKG